MTWSAVRMPTTTETTAGCRSGYAIAASGSVMPNSSQVSAMAFALAIDRLGGGAVVVVRVGRGARSREQPRVVDRGGDDAHAAVDGERKEVVERPLLEQGVATGEHDHVDVVPAHELGRHRRLVHAGAHRADDALIAKLDQRRDRLGVRRRPVVVGIVQVGDVDAIEPESLEALVDRAADAVAAEVVLPPRGGGNREALVVHRAVGVVARDEEAPDLRREHVLVAGTVGERRAEAALGQTESVVRRGVEVADAGVPGRVDRGPRLVVGRLAEQVAQLRGAEAEFGHGQAGPQRATQHRVPPGETALLHKG